MESPKVSIIVPVYNLENYITKCVQSLLQQSYRNIEIILVDDGSTDGSLRILQELSKTDNRVIVKHQENGRTARARNYALESVKGEYITFVDGDDYLTPDTLEKNIRYLIEDNTLDWVSFSVMRVDELGNCRTSSSTYGNFEVTDNIVIPKACFLSFFYNKKLSGLCCGTIYRWSSVKSIVFPVDEYYEDSFYFCETLWVTQKGMLSSEGCYLYLEREGSSQFAQVDKIHLISTLHLAERKLVHFKDAFPNDTRIISKIEDDYYYYFKLYFSKAVMGADEIYLRYCKIFSVPHKRRWLTELKLAIYRTVGYARIERYIKLLRRV